MNFSERLKNLRLEAGYTQKNLAETLNINQPRIVEWEKGKNNPNKKSLENLANLFNVSVSYLLGETDTRSELEISTIYEKLSPKGKEHVLSFAKNTLKEEQKNKIIPIIEHLFNYKVLDQALSAGTGYGYTDEQNYTTVYWNKEVDYDLATWIKGDSMEPKFYSGEVALIKEQNSIDYDGQICAVDWDGNSYIKKVYREEEGLVLVSINKKYDDKFASWEEQPRIIGKVIDHFIPIEQ